MKTGEFTCPTSLHCTHEEAYRNYVREKIHAEDGMVVPPFAHVLQGTHNIWVEVWYKVTKEELMEWRAHSKSYSADPRTREALDVLWENYQEAVERLRGVPGEDRP